MALVIVDGTHPKVELLATVVVEVVVATTLHWEPMYCTLVLPVTTRDKEVELMVPREDAS